MGKKKATLLGTPTLWAAHEHPMVAAVRAWAEATGRGDHHRLEKFLAMLPPPPDTIRGLGYIRGAFLHCYPDEIVVRYVDEGRRETIWRRVDAKEGA